ncbi:RNA methyltransferase [Ramlibacter monticola]|uniref:tRNA (cytidine/uridine-2'-O-)-methyltransferase TrmJ n=1 Tax=Ramlibacter monticola TaxID=1926872 RepID=A0A937CSF5_9BURK|nr:RNA methyltransferase [Ramlibacter monticola]MBL0390514.1 RNA methyltransferase [Ramlibacter monticola]
MSTRFVLIQPSHAGNVGAAARALKVMGFDDLVLVKPRWDDVLARDETIERASGAGDVLGKARAVDTLDEALEGMTHVCATVMTARDFGPPTATPREHLGPLAAGGAQRVAFLFGSERYGMRNEDVYRCHAALRIPVSPDYGSLNLAAAIQVIAYEWRMALGGFDAPPPASPAAADAAAVAGMLRHWEQALVEVGFLDPAAPKKLMPRLQQLFNRAQPTPEEIHILRGVAKAMSEAARKAKP